MSGDVFSVAVRVYGYPPSHNAGSEWVLHSMLRPLARAGHRVTVWLSHPGDLGEVYEVDGVRVVPFQQGTDFAARVADSDVLISHYENVPVVAALGKANRIPVVVICHDNFSATYHNAAGADLLVYNSEWIRRDGEIFYSRFCEEFLPRRSMVLRPPVFADEYRTGPGDCATLVNLNSDKGGDMFWQVAAWVPEWDFLGVRGAYGDQVMPSLRLSNCRVIDGVAGKDMKSLVYGRSRVMVMPSLYESWGRVAVEALASGIPVVAHPTPGLVESLGSAGIFAYRDDMEAWVAALRSLRDPRNWEQASRRAKERSRQLDPRRELDAWCEVIEEVAAAGRYTRAAAAVRSVSPIRWAGAALKPMKYGDAAGVRALASATGQPLSPALKGERLRSL
ncbi:glycosyltransferase family 4 protein [Kitasatospora sp. NPDC058243]|uniref:glycosyltransferase family 4 protein n=1 Tax=Kitasatospora sp. NPDC058243 TaxID=3346397 RepID=UPI0036DE5C24